MPQLQVGDFAPQLIWLALTFTVLYFALSRVAIPRVELVLSQRKSRIDGDFERAKIAQRQAEEEMAHYDAAVAAARAKGQALARERREQLEASFTEERAELNRQTSEKAAKAEDDIRHFLAVASSQLEAATSTVVSDVVRELAGVSVSDEEVTAALQKALKA